MFIPCSAQSNGTQYLVQPESIFNYIQFNSQHHVDHQFAPRLLFYTAREEVQEESNSSNQLMRTGINVQREIRSGVLHKAMHLLRITLLGRGQYLTYLFLSKLGMHRYVLVKRSF